MNDSDWTTFAITTLKRADVPNWPDLSVFLVKRLNDSIKYIGRIRITSTTGGGHASGSAHYKGLAADIRPLDRPLWHVYQILKSLGWQRIGIDAGQNILHVDVGELSGYSAPYFFLELAGKDAGPLTSQTKTQLAAIPGYNAPLTALAPGKPLPQIESTPLPVAATPVKKNVTTVDAALLLAAAIPLYITTRG